MEGRRDPHRPRARRSPIGSLPADSGKRMEFTGTTVIRVVDGKIAEEGGPELAEKLEVSGYEEWESDKVSA